MGRPTEIPNRKTTVMGMVKVVSQDFAIFQSRITMSLSMYLRTGAADELPLELFDDARFIIMVLFLPLEVGAGVGVKVAPKGIHPVGAAVLPLLDMEKISPRFRIIIPFLAVFVLTRPK